MTVLVTYKFNSKDDRDGFYNAACEMNLVKTVEAEDGCQLYRYYMPCDTELELFLLEKWETPEAQKVHCDTPHMIKLRTFKEKYNAVTELEIF